MLMRKRPRIGVTMRVELESRRFYLGRDYCEALENSGAIPFHLGLIPDPAYIAQAVEDLDGILLPGSDTDVDPMRYGQEPRPGLKRVVFEKDETEALVLAEAEKRNIPILAICYGMQALNVFRGGTLIQDIEREIESALKHDQGLPLERKSHSIDIERNTRLSRLITKSDYVVNSHHHQAIGNLGRNLRVSAKTRDGIIECIEDSRAERFVLGLQWHPEIAWREDESSRAIFNAFIEASSAS